MKNTGLKIAVLKAGGVRKLAKVLGVTRACVYAWDQRALPFKRMLEIEKKFGVERVYLRPDLYRKGDGSAYQAKNIEGSS